MYIRTAIENKKETKEFREWHYTCIGDGKKKCNSEYLVSKPAKNQAHKQMKKARVFVHMYPAFSGSQMA